MLFCKLCNDTGVIETGNNDIPCQCYEGDHAIFNVTGKGEITGAEIKRLNALPQMPTTLGDRTEDGQLFKWYGRLKFWHNTSGKPVMIVPPTTPSDSWYCFTTGSDNPMEIRGDEAEKRTFGVAAAFANQGKRRNVWASSDKI